MINKLLGFLILTLLSLNVFAKPSGFSLITPKKIEIKGEKEFSQLEITFELACKNENATDWSRVVMSYDDSGDRNVVVGVVVPSSSCIEKGPKQEYTINILLSEYDHCGKDCNETFSPMK